MTIYKKMFLVQQEIKNPKKSTKGYNYKYADLAQILEIIKPILNKHRILLVQKPVDVDGEIGVSTSLRDIDFVAPEMFEDEEYSDRDGEEIYCHFAIKPIKNDPQAVGSIVTYLRRYCLISLFNLAPEDDDGNAALETPKKDFKKHWGN